MLLRTVVTGKCVAYEQKDSSPVSVGYDFMRHLNDSCRRLNRDELLCLQNCVKRIMCIVCESM